MGLEAIAIKVAGDAREVIAKIGQKTNSLMQRYYQNAIYEI